MDLNKLKSNINPQLDVSVPYDKEILKNYSIYNGLQFGEESNLKALPFNLAQMFIRNSSV
jgi:hypothetical protein